MNTHQTARKLAKKALSDAEQLAAGRANLTRLRAEAAAHIERLIELLDLTEPDADLEPSLGSVEQHPNGFFDLSDHHGHGNSQERWSAGNTDDREGDEHDGREPGGDDEPDDSGIADLDGYMEQCPHLFERCDQRVA